jgi:hypothetical protein
MQKFFESIQSINQFTFSLDSRSTQIECQHCHQCRAWVSHGFVYKQRSIILKEPVGKRIFCSNRLGKVGCGRTVQLYLSSEIPFRQYSAVHVFLFVSALLAGLSVSVAYQRVAGLFTDRQGWRWLSVLFEKLSEFRSHLPSRYSSVGDYSFRSKRLQLLLPTLHGIFNLANPGSCSAFQFRQQSAFF